MHPVAIHFGQAIPIAVVGLGVNVASAWLLSSGGHHHHGHGHDHAEGHDEEFAVATAFGPAVLSVFEDGVPPRFRLRWEDQAGGPATTVSVETERPDGTKQSFSFVDRGSFVESVDEIPEPHAFTAHLRVGGEQDHVLVFEEHEHSHAAHDRDNNMRAALVHVMADAAVSVLVIIGLVLARLFGWLWMDPLAGIVGALVIASWSYGLIRDTGAVLLDMNPDDRLADRIRQTIEACGDAVTDLHLWRLGPGHLGAIVCVATASSRDAAFYRSKLKRFSSLSHLTVETIGKPRTGPDAYSD